MPNPFLLGLFGVLVFGMGACGSRSALSTHGRCLVIAHRGASAYLPEHTLESYALAYGQGADMIEPDVVLTADGVLVCSHDITVPNRDAMQRVFPDRARDDGEWYFLDFTVAELRSLGESPGRHGERLPGLRVATFGECVAFVQELNRRTGREVGVIPEPKRPAWHLEQGSDLAGALVHALHSAGYRGRYAAAVVQCFELDSLRRMRDELACDLPMVYLTGEPLTDDQLDEVAVFAQGIGPSFKLIETEDGEPGEDPTLIDRALARNLAIYPYTFNADLTRQRRFVDRGVTGLFTNNPDVTRGVVDREAGRD